MFGDAGPEYHLSSGNCKLPSIPKAFSLSYLFGVIKNTMMNAYFFQMNNLKGLAADESGNNVLVERLVQSNRSTFRSFCVCWTSSVSFGHLGLRTGPS